jgi:hypothetical protein
LQNISQKSGHFDPDKFEDPLRVGTAGLSSEEEKRLGNCKIASRTSGTSSACSAGKLERQQERASGVREDACKVNAEEFNKSKIGSAAAGPHEP